MILYVLHVQLSASGNGPDVGQPMIVTPHFPKALEGARQFDAQAFSHLRSGNHGFSIYEMRDGVRYVAPSMASVVYRRRPVADRKGRLPKTLHKIRWREEWYRDDLKAEHAEKK